jgi:PAS domain-containing protein
MKGTVPADDSESALRAIQSGQVDAVVIAGEDGHRLYGLHPLDIPYQQLFEALADSAIVLDPEGHITFCSPSFCRAVGRTQADLERTRLRDHIAPEDQARFDEILKAGGGGGRDIAIRLHVAQGTATVQLGLSPLPSDYFPEEPGEPQRPTGGFVAVIKAAAGSGFPALESKTVSGQAHQLASGIVSALDEERERVSEQVRISEQIQDAVLPTLTGLMLDLEWLEEKLRWTEGRPHSSVFARLHAIKDRLTQLSEKTQR